MRAVTAPLVHIHYRRPPDREEVFEQRLVLDRDDVKVTLARDLDFDDPIVIGDDVALETGSDAVWFTFPGRWHDIGRFHRADDRFTGLYANILTPPRIGPDHVWETTDLYLDVWLEPGEDPVVLDREQFDEARDEGWIDADTARRALDEVERLVEGAEAGGWPPPVVDEWTLERARERLR